MSTQHPEDDPIHPSDPDPSNENTMDESDFDRTISDDGFAAGDPDDGSDEVPKIEGYRILGPLGKGGMGFRIPGGQTGFRK